MDKKVAIIGLGGGAGKIMDCLGAGYAGSWLKLIHFDCDQRSMATESTVQAMPLGSAWTNGMGCGGDAVLGEKAASASVADIRNTIKGMDLILVVACLGGGTGSGGVQALARLLREEELMAFFFVALPMAAEGNRNRQVAEQALQNLRKTADVVVAVHNDLLFTCVAANTRASQAFAIANRHFADGILGIAELIRCDGMISIDFASLKALLKNKEAVCSFGVGRAEGENRHEDVIDNLFESPLLGGQEFVEQAHVAVATILGGDDLTIGEMNECAAALTKRLPASCNSIIGANEVPEEGASLHVTMLAIRYAGATAAPATKKDSTKTTKRRRKRNAVSSKQIPLPFADTEDNFSVGIFGNSPATIHQDQNLDIPTFQRLGIELDTQDAR